jgi:hypothetical protein
MGKKMFRLECDSLDDSIRHFGYSVKKFTEGDKKIKPSVSAALDYVKELHEELTGVIDLYQFTDKEKSIDFFEKKILGSFKTCGGGANGYVKEDVAEEVTVLFDSQGLAIDRDTMPKFMDKYVAGLKSELFIKCSLALGFMESGPQISYRDLDSEAQSPDEPIFTGEKEIADFVAYALRDEKTYSKDSKSILETVKKSFKEGVTDDFVQEAYKSLLSYKDGSPDQISAFSEATGIKIDLAHTAFKDLMKDFASSSEFMQSLYKSILDEEKTMLDSKLEGVSKLSEVTGVVKSDSTKAYIKLKVGEFASKYI